MQDTALPENAEVHAQLTRKLSNLALRPVTGMAESPWADQVSGKIYTFDVSNAKPIPHPIGRFRVTYLTHAVSLDLQGYEGGTLTIHDNRGDHQISFGYGAWQYGQTMFESEEPRSIAASGAWTADDTFTVKLCVDETPFCPSLVFQFGQGGVRYQFVMNVGFGPTARPALFGKLS